jgi:hypothetical protein
VFVAKKSKEPDGKSPTTNSRIHHRAVVKPTFPEIDMDFGGGSAKSLKHTLVILKRMPKKEISQWKFLLSICGSCF